MFHFFLFYSLQTFYIGSNNKFNFDDLEHLIVIDERGSQARDDTDE